MGVAVVMGVRVPFCNPGVPSLIVLSSHSLFNFRDDDHKGEVDRGLREGDIDAGVLRFNGMTFKDLDFSGMYLEGLILVAAPLSMWILETQILQKPSRRVLALMISVY